MADEQLDRLFFLKISTERIHSLAEIVPDWSELHCVFRAYLIRINKNSKEFFAYSNEERHRGDGGLIKQAQESLEKSFAVAVAKGLQLFLFSLFMQPFHPPTTTFPNTCSYFRCRDARFFKTAEKDKQESSHTPTCCLFSLE